ncbi:aldehyde dehydrogenase [Aureobasidium sp. EXF-10727]|nr:aldehyde dehydrogenase [Aureobasidium sp. EXF-10727]
MSPTAMPTTEQAQDSGKIETRLFINNEFVESISGRKFNVVNPYSEEVISSVYEALPEDVDRAVEAAETALPAWSEMGALARSEYYYKLAALLEAAGPELAELEAKETGKIASMYQEHVFGAKILRQFAGLALDAQGGTSLATPGHLNMVIRQPYGVCGAIVPWNIPIMAVIFKMAPALVTGNTLVVKSSEKSPLTALVLARLVKEAGFPPGVFNVLSGFGNPAGAAMASHMEISKIGFTGSGRTGRLIKEAAARSNLKRVSLELGGKSPLVIFEDADLEQAVPAAALSILYMAGQVCIASSRLYVHSSIAGVFQEKLTECIKAMSANPPEGIDPLSPEAKHSPQVDKAQFDNILRYLELAKESGGEIVLGGKKQTDKGYFIEPTVVRNPDHNSRISKEEIFGPVLCFNTFEAEEEVMQRANDTEYGLFASVYTKDLSRALRIAKKFESGMVGVNTTSPLANALDMPFGGWKASGDGVDLSKAALDIWTQMKTIYIKI